MAAPWYEASWLKPAALGAGILLLLAGLLGLRKRNAAPAGGRASLADSFGVSPLDGGSAGAHSVEAEEAELREHLKLDPANIGLHLELLSLYYAERDVTRFEDAAIDMHAQVVDPHEPEWLEAQAMGQELAPNNPLFANSAHFDDTDTFNATAHTVTSPSAAVGYNANAHGEHDEAVAFGDVAPHGESELDSRFDLDRPDAPLVAPAMPTPAAREGDRFEFDNLADLSAPTLSASTLPDFETPLPPPPLDDDYFAADDAIGTKLDLAKAYMDMGDPEGARSMLEEVVAEGSEAQRAEAQRLIADIH
jgi:pilus assembly protein FimV